MENKTKIIITRRSEWTNRLKSYKIIIDGQDAGLITNGSSEEFIVEPGKRKLQCKLGWLSSPEFEATLKQDEIIYLAIRSSAKFALPLRILFIAAMIFTYVYRAITYSYSTWVLLIMGITALPYFIYWIYHTTIGRKKYFIIEEDLDNAFSK